MAVIELLRPSFSLYTIPKAYSFLPPPPFRSQDRELGGLIKNVQTSFFGKQVCLRSFVEKDTHFHRCSTRKIVSVLDRKVKNETVVPDPDYRIPIVLLGAAGGLAYADNLLAAAPVGLLGLLLLFQTTRVKFVFDAEALIVWSSGLSFLMGWAVGIFHLYPAILYYFPTEFLSLLSVDANSVAMQEVKIGEQLDESGENIFVGGKNRWKYSSFVNWELWWPNFPILVYFKETQTKPEGQVHFFPVIFNGKQLYDVMVERAGPSKTSGLKP